MANVSSANVSFGDYEDITTYTEYKAGELIWKIVPPILIILGTFGNSLSILVLTRRCIRSSTTALFLTVLAFSDLCVLYTGLLRQWLIHLFEVDVRTISEFGCKLNIWLVYSSLDFSAWILIVVTLERVISAWLPHKAKTLCTKKSAVALLMAVIVFIMFLNAHLLYGMVFRYSASEHGGLKLEKCVEINDDYRDFFNATWPWIDFCVFCFIPFIVILTGNALILFKVLKSQRKVKSRIVPSAHHGNRQGTTTGHMNKQSSMTAMLFTLNVVFLISTSPVSIYNIGYPYWSENANAQDNAKLDLWWAVVNMLMYVNNSLNFLLYCLSGTKFRIEVIRIFCSWRYGNNATHVQLAANSNYTRTKFETPSPTPSPRHSDIFTVNKPNSNHQISSNVDLPETVNQTGIKTPRHSSNNLHPNDALKTSNDIRLCKENNKGDHLETNKNNTSTHTLLDKNITSTTSTCELEKDIKQKPQGRDSIGSDDSVFSDQPDSKTEIIVRNDAICIDEDKENDKNIINGNVSVNEKIVNNLHDPPNVSTV